MTSRNTELTPNGGIPRRLMLMMAILAGVTVANLYYNQPLLEDIRADIGLTQQQANMVTVITQVGYAMGLFLIVPLGDKWSRRKLITMLLMLSAIMCAAIALSTDVMVLWPASLLLGMSSVTPQLFIPIAGQYSRKENKSRNMGYILSGLLTGILASRVLSGLVGEWLGWRWMFWIAALMMIAGLTLVFGLLPQMRPTFHGSYASLLHSVWQIVRSQPKVRLYAVRAAFGFGSMLSIWACMAFHVAEEPLSGGADKVGLLGLCGVVGALIAANIGRLIPKYGIRRFSILGAVTQMLAWTIAVFFGGSYIGLAMAIIIIDIGMQELQLSNQSGCLQTMPEATNRVNTIFMTIYFIGGSLGTFLAGWGWTAKGWSGVCLMGLLLAASSLMVSVLNKN